MKRNHDMNGLSIGALREALIEVMDLGGAWGQNMHESKPAVIQIGDSYWHLGTVKSSFQGGRFVLILEAGEPFQEG